MTQTDVSNTNQPVDFPRKSSALKLLLWPLLFGWVLAFVIATAFDLEVLSAVAVATAAGVLLVLAVLLFTTRLISGQLGAKPADMTRHALLYGTTEALCLTSGLPNPRLAVFEESIPTVVVYGIRLGGARLCVSRGFFSQLSAVEQEALVAHGLYRIHRGDFRADSLAAVIFGVVLAPLGLRRLAGRGVRRSRGQNALLAADMAAVQLTRYPTALISVLNGISAQRSPKLPSHLDHLQILPRQRQKQSVENRIGILAEA